MTVARSRWAGALGALCSVVAARALAAQVVGSVDLGASTVRYDGFLASGAASVSPALLLEHPRSALSARGTYLVFESGNTSLQGNLTGSVFLPRAGSWRGEVHAAAGASRYADFASFWHALGSIRVHLLGRPTSAWVDGSVGRTSYGRAPRPVVAVAAGAWTRRFGVVWTLSASHSRVGDTVYTDIGTLARGRRGGLEVEGTLAARLWSQGGGHGVFGEASAVVNLSELAGIVVAGGRYPTDPVRGSISGRYFTAAVRLRTLAPRRPPPPRLPVPAYAVAGPAGSVASAVAWLEVSPAANGGVRLVVQSLDAFSVEIAGDFTDWQPVALARAGPSRWEAVITVSPGLHRINVRLDGGPWIVPAGATRAADDFGGEIGIFVVP